MKQELFNNKTKAEDYQRQPKQLGLYEASHEHDACGVGMLVNIQGGKSHELVESALKVLENMSVCITALHIIIRIAAAIICP